MTEIESLKENEERKQAKKEREKYANKNEQKRKQSENMQRRGEKERTLADKLNKQRKERNKKVSGGTAIEIEFDYFIMICIEAIMEAFTIILFLWHIPLTCKHSFISTGFFY